MILGKEKKLEEGEGAGGMEAKSNQTHANKGFQSLSRSSSSMSFVKVDLGVDAPTCKCGLQCPLRTSWTTANPRRRFFGCSMYDAHKKAGQCRFFLWFDRETCPWGKEVLPQLRNELNCLKEEVIQLRARKMQLTQMLLFLTVVVIAFLGVWLMGCKVIH
ncbi:uncharacterized protein LOC133853649 [Alnus glutinosa]|uniref:uncharacterized protein LOC133853649 n=1 Tax=Alnus glutinosa TaxID=3517 RepID=UPI002D77DFBC|nr:uncharacterized protein LOC133853649 [Alnus glutinosa]